MHHNTELQTLGTRTSNSARQPGSKGSSGALHQPAPSQHNTPELTEIHLLIGGKPIIITLPRPQPPPSPRPRPRPGPIAPGPPPGNPTPPPTPRRPAHGRVADLAGGAGNRGPAVTTLPRPQPPPSPRPRPRPGPVAPGPPPGVPTPPPTPRRPAATGAVGSPVQGGHGLSTWAGGLFGFLRGVR